MDGSGRECALGYTVVCGRAAHLRVADSWKCRDRKGIDRIRSSRSKAFFFFFLHYSASHRCLYGDNMLTYCTACSRISLDLS